MCKDVRRNLDLKQNWNRLLGFWLNKIWVKQILGQKKCWLKKFWVKPNFVDKMLGQNKISFKKKLLDKKIVG